MKRDDEEGEAAVSTTCNSSKNSARFLSFPCLSLGPGSGRRGWMTMMDPAPWGGAVDTTPP